MAAKTNKTYIYLGAGAIGLGLVGYKLGWWGEAYKGSDQNAAIDVSASKLKHSRVFYKNVADLLYRQFNKIGITFGGDIIALLSNLNSEELKQVVKDFGTRASTISVAGFSIVTGPKKNLFEWIEESHFTSTNLAALHNIFKSTDLW